MAREQTQSSDPADALTRRGMLVVIVGGFLLFQIPSAVARLLDGGAANQIGAILSLAFSAWLVWRLSLMLRHRDVTADPRYWMVGAAGYGVLAGLFIAFDVWRWAAGAYDGADLGRASISVILLLGLAALSVVAGRKARANGTSQPLT